MIRRTAGWINRALTGEELGEFVATLAQRIAGFPAAGRVAVKDRVNAIPLVPVEDFRRDSDRFGDGVSHPEAQARIQAAMQRGDNALAESFVDSFKTEMIAGH
jgi:hypothetical protein